MYPLQYSLVFHLVGVGMLFTTIFAGFLLHVQYKRTKDHAAKVIHLKSSRAVGLLSPAGVLLLLLTGLGNMTLGAYRYTLFSDGWLSTKLVLFVLMVIVGVVFAIQGSRRMRLVTRLAGGQPNDLTTARLQSLDRQIVLSYVVQFLLLLGIITLSVVRPQG